jgi:hypothetical protein
MAPVDITAVALAVFLLPEVLVLVVLRQAVAEPLTCVLGQRHYPIASLWQVAAAAADRPSLVLCQVHSQAQMLDQGMG